VGERHPVSHSGSIRLLHTPKANQYYERGVGHLRAHEDHFQGENIVFGIGGEIISIPNVLRSCYIQEEDLLSMTTKEIDTMNS